MGFAYTAKAASSSTVTAPTDWPRYWPWPPPHPVVVWPPDWPKPINDDDDVFTLVVTADPDAIAIDDYSTIEVQILLNLANTALLNGYTIRLTAAIGETDVEISNSLLAGTWADYFDVNVSNYAGAKYGCDQSIYFNLAAGDRGSSMTVTATVLGVTAALTGSDTVEVPELAPASCPCTSWPAGGYPWVTEPCGGLLDEYVIKAGSYWFTDAGGGTWWKQTLMEDCHVYANTTPSCLWFGDALTRYQTGAGLDSTSLETWFVDLNASKWRSGYYAGGDHVTKSIGLTPAGTLAESVSITSGNIVIEEAGT